MRRSLLPGPAFAALALVLALGSPAIAQEKAPEKDEGPRFTRSGPFIGVGLAISQAQFSAQKPPVPGDPDSGYDPALGYSVRLGYRVNEFVAAEFALRQTFNRNGDGQLLSATPGLRLYPFGVFDWRFQPSVIAQIGYLHGDIKRRFTIRKGFTARVGGGLEAYVTEHVAIFGDVTYMVASGDTSSLDHIAYDIGLVYRF